MNAERLFEVIRFIEPDEEWSTLELDNKVRVNVRLSHNGLPLIELVRRHHREYYHIIHLFPDLDMMYEPVASLQFTYDKMLREIDDSISST